MVHEVLVGLEVVARHQRHLRPELLQDRLVVLLTHALQQRNLLAVLLPLLPTTAPLSLLLQFVLGQQVPVLGEETEDGDRGSDLRLSGSVFLDVLLVPRGLELFPDLSLLVDLVHQDLGDFLQSVGTIGLPVVLGPRPPHRSRVLAEILFELSQLEPFLLVVVGGQLLPDQPRPGRVVSNGLQLLNGPAILVGLFSEAVLERVFEMLEVGNVFNEVLAAVVLEVVVVSHLFGLLQQLLSFSQQSPPHLHRPRLITLGLAEQFPDAILGGATRRHGGAHPQHPRQLHSSINYNITTHIRTSSGRTYTPPPKRTAR